MAEYLFSDEKGVLQQVEVSEAEIIYNGYLQRLISAYDRVKSKFNTYAVNCLTDRVKRECGISLVAP